MKKKLLGVLLCVAMSATLLAGCGNNGGTNNKADTNANDDANAEDDTKDDAKVEEGASSDENTLTVWCWDPKFNIYAMEEAGKIYQKDHPEFNINVIETPWDDIQKKLTTAATGGALDTLPDIMLVQDNAFQKNVISFPEVFTDLTDSGVDFSQFGEAKTAYSVVDGKNYGVPFDNGTVVACYRTDVLEEAGFTVDDFTDITWEDYLEKGKVVLEKTGKPLLSCQSTESDVIMMMLQSCGASLFDDEGNPNMVGNEPLKKVMETYQQLVETGVCKLVNSWDEYVQTLTTETVAGTINGCWIMASIQSAEDQSGKWALTNMPKLSDVEGATNYSNNGGSSWAITSNCKNMDLAKDFLKSTFAGSVELYENILPSSGALATYLPAGESDVYAQPSEFYGGDAVFKKITEYASKCPSNNTGVYYYEARDAIATAIQNVVGGSDIDTELQTAQGTVEQLMDQ
ncbi:MAG: extracellular solute-binding protein [Lachnospiraceae bacterium]|nr:extracellular solute-binding protein [Lachnospiraceae bacterium]